MGRYHREKGYRMELGVVHQAKSWGFHARRQFMSGALRGMPDDVILTLPPPHGEQQCECKIRGDGFAAVYHALAKVKIAFIRRDRGEILVAMRASDFYKFMGGTVRVVPQEVDDNP